MPRLVIRLASICARLIRVCAGALVVADCSNQKHVGSMLGTTKLLLPGSCRSLYGFTGAGRMTMSHWRKAHEPTWRINAFILWAITTSAILATIVLIARHIHT